MMLSLRAATRYPLAEEAAFQAHVRREPCTVVLFRGRQCPYSASLEPKFEEIACGDEQWSFVVRECRSGDQGEVNERYGIRITPTVVAFRDGKEWRRIEARPLVGLTMHRLMDWLDGLDAGET